MKKEVSMTVRLEGPLGDIVQKLADDDDRSIGYGNQWLGKVHQHYKESQTLAVAKSKGYIFRGKEVIQTANGPQIRLQFVAR